MAILIATAKAANANSYCTVAEADEILGNDRLYSSTWTGTSELPDGADYTANGGDSAGASSVTVAGGSGMFTEGSKVTFGSDTTLYELTENFYTSASHTEIKITPVLAANVADGAAVARATANSKESGLIWATLVLDQSFNWDGSKRTSEQALRWPRGGTSDLDGKAYDYDLVPEIVKRATAELAMALLERNRLELPGLLGKGISFAELEGLGKVRVDEDQMVDLIPSFVSAIVDHVGQLKSSAMTGDRIVKITRG